jgi:hypothetical protein
MRSDQIPFFVKEVLSTGATLYAAGKDHYFFGDLDVPDDKAEEITARVNGICERYGPRDHLQTEIASHLLRLGLEIDGHGECRVLRWLDRSARSTPCPALA